MKRDRYKKRLIVAGKQTFESVAQSNLSVLVVYDEFILWVIGKRYREEAGQFRYIQSGQPMKHFAREITGFPAISR